MTTYAIGTASVANGDTTITFAGASLGTTALPTFKAGDLFADPAQPLVPPQRLASVNYGAGTAELWVGWPGTSMPADPYEVRFVDDGVRTTAQTRRYLELLGQLSALGLQPNAFGVLADRDTYDDEAAGFIFLAVGDPWTLYIKLSATSADWDAGQTIEGPPPNSLEIGTVVVGSAAATITGAAPTQTLNLTLPAGAAGEPLICQIQDVDGIAPGTFSAVAYYHGAASCGHLYAEILAGTGDAVFHIHQNGVEVYGPVTVDSDSDPVDVSDLGVTLASGDTLDVVVTSADATITSLMIQMDGSA